MARQEMKLQPPSLEEAISYVHQVKNKFVNHPEAYREFLYIFRELYAQRLDYSEVKHRLSNLFRGHPELMVGLNPFLEPCDRIEVQPNEQVQVSIPGTHMCSWSVSTDPTLILTHPVRAQSVTQERRPNYPAPLIQTESSSYAVPNSSSKAHVAQMAIQEMQFQQINVKDFLSYLFKVQDKFWNQPQVYDDFMLIMEYYISESRDTHRVMQLVAKLFRGHPDLIASFTTLMLPAVEQLVQLSIPETNMGSGGVSTGPSSLTIHNVVSPSATPTMHPNHPLELNQIGSSTLSSPGSSTTNAHVAQTARQEMQFQRINVKEFLSYLFQVREKFRNQPQVYDDFMLIMEYYRSESSDTDEVIQRVAKLFRGHPDLIASFNTLMLPGCRIEVQLSIPETNIGRGGVSTGPSSLTIHNVVSPSATPTMYPNHPLELNQIGSSPLRSPGSSTTSATEDCE